MNDNREIFEKWASTHFTGVELNRWPDGQYVAPKVESAWCGYQEALKNSKMREALEKIAKWDLPTTGIYWDDAKTQPMSYEACYGTNGSRDYFKEMALAALTGGESKEELGRRLIAEAKAEHEATLDAKSKEIYESWSDQEGYVPWIIGGNSNKQCEARRLAFTELLKKDL